MRAEYETPIVRKPDAITIICASAANRSRLADSATISCASGLFQ
jgi:hypothetical protein